MRILYFTRDYTPHDHRFLTALASSPHQVYFLRLERSGMQREDRPLPPEIEQVRWRGGQRPAKRTDYPTLMLDLMLLLNKIQPDVVHAGPIQSAAFLTALSGFEPLVSMSWGSDLLKDAYSRRSMTWATHFTLQHTTVLVGDCQAVKDKAAEFGFPGERVVLFPWGVDLKAFQPGREDEFRARRGWEDAFVLLSNRSWEPLYGVEGVVRAFIEAACERPELRLLLLGGGSQSSQLRQMLVNAGMLERVFFGGQVANSELATYYRAADLYLSASHSDGSSVSLMEALACGKPVLVSDIPGNKEWIEPGVQGWLFPDGNWGALRDGILNAVDHPEHLPEMGRAARVLAERRADWNQNFQQLLRAYEMAVELAHSSGQKS